MEKLNNNELLICNGGNIIITFTNMFVNMVNVIKKLKIGFGGIK